MPKVADQHFDVAGLCEQVLAQPIGLAVSTNNPDGFRRIVYKHMRQNPQHSLHVYTSKRSKSFFYLVKKSAGAANAR